jgi:TonB family protein
MSPIAILMASAAMAVAMAVPVPQESAKLSSGYLKWLNEDVVYIITGRERAEFLKLTTDEQRDQFIEQFWQDRNPPPGAPQHDAKAEHYRRIAFANEHFGTASGTPGWKTDRGYLYILFGPPDEITSHPNGTEFRPWPYELWDYWHVEGNGGVNFLFADPEKNGNCQLTWNPFVNYNPNIRFRVRVGTKAEERNLITKVEPIYPERARRRRIQGVVRLEVVIGEGHVSQVRLIQGHRLLVAAARDAVRQWVYKPVLIDWEPLEVVTEVDVKFSLEGK